MKQLKCKSLPRQNGNYIILSKKLQIINKCVNFKTVTYLPGKMGLLSKSRELQFRISKLRQNYRQVRRAKESKALI